MLPHFGSQPSVILIPNLQIERVRLRGGALSAVTSSRESRGLNSHSSQPSPFASTSGPQVLTLPPFQSGSAPQNQHESLHPGSWPPPPQETTPSCPPSLCSYPVAPQWPPLAAPSVPRFPSALLGTVLMYRPVLSCFLPHLLGPHHGFRLGWLISSTQRVEETQRLPRAAGGDQGFTGSCA